jgi:hypothetical protein
VLSQDRLQLQAGQTLFIEGKIHTSSVIDDEIILKGIIWKLWLIN